MGPHSVGESDVLQEAFHVGIEGSAADDDFVEVAAEYLHGLAPGFVLDAVVDEGHTQQQLADGVVDAG